jgi:hypothetical protein
MGKIRVAPTGDFKNSARRGEITVKILGRIVDVCAGLILTTDLEVRPTGRKSSEKKSKKVLTGEHVSANLNLKTEEGLPKRQPH